MTKKVYQTATVRVALAGEYGFDKSVVLEDAIKLCKNPRWGYSNVRAHSTGSATSATIVSLDLSYSAKGANANDIDRALRKKFRADWKSDVGSATIVKG